MGKEKGTDNKNPLTLRDLLFLLSVPLLLAHLGPQKAKDNKKNKSLTSKSLRVKGSGFVIFVVFSLLGAQVGKEKGTDNKNSKSLRVKC